MKPSKFIKTGLLLLPLSFTISTAQAKEKPNVLLIYADDLGYHDLECQGAEDLNTPRIDKLAESGVRFTNGYVTAPQCGPSRAGLMTGVNQSRFGYLDNNNQNGLPPKEIIRTMPEQFKQEGYATGMIGKWHIGFIREKEEGDIHLPGNQPGERGFNYVLKHWGGSTHYFPYREDGWKWMKIRNREPRLKQKLKHQEEASYLNDLSEDTYLTDYFSEKSVQFIKRNSDKPWFLYLSYNAPHTPLIAKEEILKNYSHIEDERRQKFAAMMESLDKGVGQVLDALKTTEQLENTLVWFISDNGGPTSKNASSNAPLSGVKGDLHEGGIRVPFIVSWPGTIPGEKVISDPVISLDVLPTSLAAAGVDSLRAIYDGNNLLPWLKGKADCPNFEFYWEWRNKTAIRLGPLKEVHNNRNVWTWDKSLQVPAHVFSDVVKNPKEIPSKSVLGSEKKDILTERLDQWLKQLARDQKLLTPSYNLKSKNHD